MKLNKFLSFFAIAFLFAGSAFSAVTVKEDGTYKGLVEVINYTTSQGVSVSGDVATVVVEPLSTTVTALTAGATPTLTVGTGNQLFTDTITTDNQDQTITFSGAGSAGDQIRIIFITDAAGSGDEVITFHSTLVRSTGTLTLANAAASRYVVTFVSDGTKWNEVSRTAIQAA